MKEALGRAYSCGLRPGKIDRLRKKRLAALTRMRECWHSLKFYEIVKEN
jgi:hypothetical protein